MLLNRRLAVLSAAVAASLLGSPAAHAVVGYGGGTYTQDFNTDSGKNLNLPIGPAGATLNSSQKPWADDFTLDGWYYTQTLSNANGGYQRLRASAGTTTASLYSFGSSSTNTERAIGMVGSATFSAEGQTGQYLALRIRNTSSTTYTSFDLSYFGEQWNNGGSGAAQSILFSYKLDAAGLTDSTYTPVAALNFTSPVIGTSSATNIGNTTGRTPSAIASTITGINWEPGQDLWLRWTDINQVGSDDGLGIDDLSFSASGSGTATSHTYTSDSDGLFSDPAKWTNGLPSSSATLARLGSQITADRTVTVDAATSVSGLMLSPGTHNYTVAASGAGALNISSGGVVTLSNGVYTDQQDPNNLGSTPENLPSGTSTISVPLNFASSAEFNVGDHGTLTITDAVSAAGGAGLHKVGNGDLVLAHANSYSGPTVIDGGSVAITAGNQLGDNSPTNGIVVNNGGQIKLNADLTMSRSLTFAGDGGVSTGFNVNLGGVLNAPTTSIFTKTGSGTFNVAKLNAGAVYVAGVTSSSSAGVLQVIPNGTDAGVSRISFLRMQTDAGGLYLGKLDITDNALVIDYTGTSPLTNSTTFTSAGGTTLSGGSKIATALWYAYDSGHWDRTGITSSLAATAAADPKSVNSVAYAEASGLLGLTGADTAVWHGQTVDATSILLMYTLAGDANMNGKIDSDDYAIVDRAIALGTFNTGNTYNTAAAAGTKAQWINGDFNYDGAVDVNDLLLIDKSLATQNGGSLSADFLNSREAQYGSEYVSSLLASIPEPTTLTLLAAAAFPLASRRRRSC